MRGLAQLILLATLVATFGPACEKPSAPNAGHSIDTSNLVGHWVHSREEETAESNIHIYRPADYQDFAPSRFRMRYKFHEDGTCDWLYLHPADAHHFKDGTWQIVSTADSILNVDQDGNEHSFKIVELKPNLLRMISLAQ